MDASQSPHDPARRLRTLLRDAEILSFRGANGSRVAIFSSRTREWNINYRISEGWFMMRTFICDLPTEPGRCAKLIEHLMRENARYSLVKFTAAATTLTLDCEYRDEHVDRKVVGDLTGFMLTTLNERYPAIFRIATGDDVLAQLDYTAAQNEAA